MGSRQHQHVALTTRRGHHHHDLAHSGHAGRHRVHEQRGRVGCLSPGDVDAHTVQRRDLLTQEGSILVVVLPAQAAGLQLTLVVLADSAGSLLQRFPLLGRDRRKGLLEIPAAQLKLFHGLRVERVEAAGALQHRGVAPAPDIGNDFRHPLLDGLVLVFRPMQQGFQARLKVGLRGAQPAKRSLHLMPLGLPLPPRSIGAAGGFARPWS